MYFHYPIFSSSVHLRGFLNKTIYPVMTTKVMETAFYKITQHHIKGDSTHRLTCSQTSQSQAIVSTAKTFHYINLRKKTYSLTYARYRQILWPSVMCVVKKRKPHLRHFHRHFRKPLPEQIQTPFCEPTLKKVCALYKHTFIKHIKTVRRKTKTVVCLVRIIVGMTTTLLWPSVICIVMKRKPHLRHFLGLGAPR